MKGLRPFKLPLINNLLGVNYKFTLAKRVWQQALLDWLGRGVRVVYGDGPENRSRLWRAWVRIPPPPPLESTDCLENLPVPDQPS